jgi:predicted dehydrogenase/threonine dehydrogenase-like Zn-dependent dehydrogenase
MKQVLQHLRTGQIELADVPCPAVRPGYLLIQSAASLISAGTERMLVEFGRGSLLAKARSQPDKVKQVLQKIKTDGLLPTLEAVFSRLDEPLPLGYCNAGCVIEVGAGVEGYAPGDRVASNGPHAEMVCVPANLSAKIPDGVEDASASFTVLGSIALHGVRLLQPTLGESFVVVGLGLLGQIGAQLLRASGCNVLGVDVNAKRCELVRSFGCQAVAISEGSDPVQAALAFSKARGVDGVLITAAAKTDEIMQQSAAMCRKRGRIVLVGTVGLNLRRSDFYEKELTFQVSCSYGPGRYDPVYEDQNRDYPLPYVRWTEGRNFEAMLSAIASGFVNVKPLITKTLPHAQAADAYDAVLNDSSVLGAVFQYPDQPPPTKRITALKMGSAVKSQSVKPRVAVIGSGNFTKVVLLPAIKAAGGDLLTVASAGGVTSFHAARKFEAEEATTDYRAVLQDPRVNAVFITTRHNAHANMAAEALAAGKHVFVEKPLAIDEAGLAKVKAAYDAAGSFQLMVGFNRRFAPHAVEARRLLKGRSQPVAVSMLVNAGDIPSNHWTHDPAVGGGRIIGEACHFIDLLLFLVGSPIVAVQSTMFGPAAGGLREDKMSLNLSFADGSIGAIHYWANGSKSYPKERVEIFSEGRVLVMDNWRRLSGFDWPAVKSMKMSQDKGHKSEVALFLERIATGGEPLIPFDQLEMVTLASFAAVKSARESVPVVLRDHEKIGEPVAETPA